MPGPDDDLEPDTADDSIGPERLRSSGSSAARLLLRSAELDAPPPLTRARAQLAVERLIEAPRSRAPRLRLDLAVAALGGAAAALLVVWFFCSR